MDKIKPNIITQIFILALILLLGGMIFFEMIPYLSGVLGALTFYVLLVPFQEKMEKIGINPTLAALTLMLISMIIILLPISLFGLLLFSKASDLITNSDKYINYVKEQMSNLEQTLGFSIMKEDSASKAATWLSQQMGSFANSLLVIIVAIGIMYFILYYMLVKRDKIYNSLLNYFPLSQKNIEIIASESKALIKANAIGIPLVAVSQGLVALISFLIVSAPDSLFWFVVTTIGSFLPYGTIFGILPVALIMYSQGDHWQAIFIMVYAAAIVGSTDNLLRMTILRKMQDVHPLITLIGVIIGVPLFGFLGIIFGPVLLSLFLLIVKLYKKEYGTSN